MVLDPSLANISLYNFSMYGPDMCMQPGKTYSPECLQKWFCPQISSHIVNSGFWVVGLYIGLQWLLWWFFNHGYKMLADEKIPLVGNLYDVQTRIYWDVQIRFYASKMLLGWIVMVLYFYH